ncbi:flavin monoamine oxidase family protein [Mycolicibacterium cosmeticum]|uniref:flavin monoamine oxidase family protein n=1 Tax=Mycolicibacterium cosmeticum TaxID=258533 RepID=UPI001F3FFF29|nr:NAD(P)/FAD-dependent oxidoreductase [Mycolicibacterium cosmeticum]
MVVGGGFAGITAARELTQRGASVIVVEARDRLGGRTWTRPSALGKSLEIGGTWVHWSQPHVWAEVERFGLPLTSSPSPTTALWRAGGQVRRGTAEEMFALLDPGMSAVLAGSAEVFPNPFRIHPVTDAVKSIDHLTIAEKIEALGLDEEQHALVEGMWALNFSGSPTVAAYTQGLRWCALTGGNWRLLFEACATYKLAGGTKSLLDAIAAQSTAQVRLNSRVRGIISDTEGARVELSTGEVLTARQVVVTLPLNILSSIEFAPALPSALAAVAREGQASTGCKVWVRVRGSVGAVAALGPSSCPLNFFQYEGDLDDDSLIVAFGADARKIDVTDQRAVETALRQWIPDLEVVAVDGHDWVADALSGETWPMLRPNQLEAVHNATRSARGRVRLAGSDYAEGWAGFIDGAIESGKKVAVETLAALHH